MFEEPAACTRRVVLREPLDRHLAREAPAGVRIALAREPGERAAGGVGCAAGAVDPDEPDERALHPRRARGAHRALLELQERALGGVEVACEQREAREGPEGLEARRGHARGVEPRERVLRAQPDPVERGGARGGAGRVLLERAHLET